MADVSDNISVQSRAQFRVHSIVPILPEPAGKELDL